MSDLVPVSARGRPAGRLRKDSAIRSSTGLFLTRATYGVPRFSRDSSAPAAVCAFMLPSCGE